MGGAAEYTRLLKDKNEDIGFGKPYFWNLNVA
jgi:hypothetical protein